VPLGDEVALWVRLQQTPGVGPETARKLMTAFGLPEEIFSAGFSALQKVVSERIASALTAPIDEKTTALIELTLDWITQPGNHLITLADEDYPKALHNIADPPIMLYVKGRRELLSHPSIAVVGSRNATTQGVSNAERFSETLSRAGLTIISGMALGIDTAAHQGGLRGKHHDGGSTIAVIGTGADSVYPARNRALAHQIAEAGCIVSEYPLGTPPVANFPRRNRIISGLAQGVLVIEAAAQSGSLITARMAAEQGREVFAIPGSIHSPLSKGCHQLIRQGAKLVESAQDILEELGHLDVGGQGVSVATAAVAPSPETSALLAAMGSDPIDANTLAARCSMDAATLNVQLLTLEMDGLVETLPGAIYRRVVLA
jgi:DNA processing protein